MLRDSDRVGGGATEVLMTVRWDIWLDALQFMPVLHLDELRCARSSARQLSRIKEFVARVARGNATRWQAEDTGMAFVLLLLVWLVRRDDGYRAAHHPHRATR